ncbi:hypothetical protein WI36_26060 [Burkholderia ubonensis]|uniref:hypothetical protein n=1 Tax=Burkholderia ubonensis TaxID=101571 RepID=UPI0007579849|nr:hypothetical protein [Burkholderia ubonensis]KUZ65821.1 hypothetical protein WI36_26060 [Burkholderia ubonensis]
MDYQINISISSKGLDTIYDSGLFVTLVKSVISNPISGGNLPVAWVAFQPLHENQVSWEEQYTMYATTTTLQAGATIKMTSQTDTQIQPGWIYTFERGKFSEAQGGDPGTFNLRNQQSTGSFSFGLAQPVLINNVQTSSPLNAVPVPYNVNATFTPIQKLSLFLSSYSNNGSVITAVASNALNITLTSTSPQANVGFNDQTNTFYLKKTGLRSTREFVGDLAAAQAIADEARTGLRVA